MRDLRELGHAVEALGPHQTAGQVLRQIQPVRGEMVRHQLRNTPHRQPK